MNTIQDYLDNLETFIHDPKSVGFGEDIIPVAMWLRNFKPGSDNHSSHNKSSLAIRATLLDIVEVPLNDISRLMVLNGYSIGNNELSPEWLMEPISTTAE